ncbi:hypothetical protein Tco_1343959 [Tanacetum coccineum]
MSSDNASSAVTYTSISSDSNGLSWGIPLVNAGELPEIDPYEEVAQQGQAPPLSPAYVPDPIELDEHVPPYADNASPTPELPGYIADSDSMEGDFIDYPDEPEDGEEDPEEDPSEEHEPEDDDEDPEEDPNKEHEPGDEDTKEEEPSKGSDKIESFEEDETAITPTTTRQPGMRYCYRAAMIRMRDDILEEDMPPRRRFVLTAFPLGCDVAKSFAATAARAPRGQYDFIDIVEAGQGLIRSPSHDAQTIARAADRAEDVG